MAGDKKDIRHYIIRQGGPYVVTLRLNPSLHKFLYVCIRLLVGYMLINRVQVSAMARSMVCGCYAVTLVTRHMRICCRQILGDRRIFDTAS